MKATRFTLSTHLGPVTVSTNFFWEEYCHCVAAHPEEEPIQSAIEHCLGARIVTGIPPMVRLGCGEVVAFYRQRAVPGNAWRAKRAFLDKYPFEVGQRKQEEAYRKYREMLALEMMEAKGPMQ